MRIQIIANVNERKCEHLYDLALHLRNVEGVDVSIVEQETGRVCETYYYTEEDDE